MPDDFIHQGETAASLPTVQLIQLTLSSEDQIIQPAKRRPVKA